MTNSQLIIPLDRSILAFDYGTKKTGIAVGTQGIVQALTILPTRKKRPDFPLLSQLVEQWQPGGFVVGYPLQGGNQLDAVRTQAMALCSWLEKHFQSPAEMVDESYSSCAVKEIGGNKPIDHHCAAIILQQWYNQHPTYKVSNK